MFSENDIIEISVRILNTIIEDILLLSPQYQFPPLPFLTEYQPSPTLWPWSLGRASFLLLEWSLWSRPQSISKPYFPSHGDWGRGGHVKQLEPMRQNEAFARAAGKMAALFLIGLCNEMWYWSCSSHFPINRGEPTWAGNQNRRSKMCKNREKACGSYENAPLRSPAMRRMAQLLPSESTTTLWPGHMGTLSHWPAWWGD